MTLLPAAPGRRSSSPWRALAGFAAADRARRPPRRRTPSASAPAAAAALPSGRAETPRCEPPEAARRLRSARLPRLSARRHGASLRRREDGSHPRRSRTARSCRGRSSTSRPGSPAAASRACSRWRSTRSYATNRRFYVDYTERCTATRAWCATAPRSGDPDVAVPSSARVLLRVDQPYAEPQRRPAAVRPDGGLYVGMGDGGSGGDPQRRAQNPRSRLGKLLRLERRTARRCASTSTRRGCATRGGSPSTARPARCGSAMSARTRGRRSTTCGPGHPPGANFGWNGYEGTHVYNATVAAR